MSALSHPPPDPLVAGLPPTLDYISYLTLLEYQLTPENLPTLNRLLLDDDGTLAEEIGWDLLKLVLPMLPKVPEEAGRCLEIIARRGNPREVVVKIAEVLESMGDNFDGAEEEDELEDDDELRTFAGEADRIHLGSMILDGMPQATAIDGGITGEQDSLPVDDEDSDHSTSTAPLELENLLRMLSIVHPRIKTEFPSRFLTTSLTAALRAYRHVTITTNTTSSFLLFLSKLSGKQRPDLPPRASTTTVSAAILPESAPLPDPEASGITPNSKSPSSNETAIVQRLLQAVMLEVVEEYASSLQSQDLPYLSWTARLRELLEPRRVLPGRSTENQMWETADDLSGRDALIARGLRLAKDLNLDVNGAFNELMENINGKAPSGPLEDPADSAETASPSEFPQTPSEIPFPQIGVLLVFTASHFLQCTKQPTNPTSSQLPPVFPTLSLLYLALRTLSSHTGVPLPPTTADALFALLYLSSHTSPPASVPPQTFVHFIADLLSFAATSPDASLRDSAHAIATKIFHAHPVVDDRVRAAKEILEMNEGGLQSGLGVEGIMVTSVIVDYVKDEFLTFLRRAPAAEPAGIDPALLDSDSVLQSLLFPAIKPVSARDDGQTHNDPDTVRMELQMLMPAHVARLNLFCVLRARTKLTLDDGERMVGTLKGIMGQLKKEGEGHGAEEFPLALEDALARAVAVARPEQ